MISLDFMDHTSLYLYILHLEHCGANENRKQFQYVYLVLLIVNQIKLSEEDLENKNSDIDIFNKIKYIRNVR